MTARDIEVAVAHHFNYRRNLIIPNVYWGMGLNYEADLIIFTPANLATEVEIKVSLQDLKADKLKRKWLYTYKGDRLISRRYFAIPASMYEKAVEHIPEHAGILTVSPSKYVQVMRPAKVLGRKHLPDHIRQKLLHLGCLRIWSLKERLQQAQTDIKLLREETKPIRRSRLVFPK